MVLDDKICLVRRPRGPTLRLLYIHTATSRNPRTTMREHLRAPMLIPQRSIVIPQG